MNKLVEALAPGMRVWVSTMNAESALLRDQLQEEPDRARGVTFMGVQFPGVDHMDYLAVHPQARLWGCFMTPALRRGLAQDRADWMPLDYLAVAHYLQEMEPVDLAIAQLTMPDAQGWCSPGVSADFMPLVWSRAKRRIAHLNPRMPRTQSSFRVHVSELDGWFEADRPVAEFHERPAGEVEARIAAHVAEMVRDGDTLQFGIGGVPLSTASALRNHRRLRIHTGLATSALRTLWDSGALDGDAPCTAGTILGDNALQDFAAALPKLQLRDVRYTHDPAVIGTIARFIAVNGAVEVDLFGQVNSERAHGTVQAGAGGLPAFAAGARRSPGGRLVICLPATAKGGTLSRITPAIGSKGLVTLGRHCADAVVTEFGSAHLRGLNADERAQALIAIAAPEHRPRLATAWQDMRHAA